MNRILVPFLLAFAAFGYAPVDGDHERTVDLTKLSIADLIEKLDTAKSHDYFVSQRSRADSFEAILQEIIKRGGSEAETAILKILDGNVVRLKAGRLRLENLDSEKDRDAWVQQSILNDRL